MRHRLRHRLLKHRVLFQRRVSCHGPSNSQMLNRRRWCGNGFLYCSAPSCQIEYGPACDANVRPSGSDTTNIARPALGRIPYGQAIYHCEQYGDIALTYDDGPYTYTEDLLDLLAVSWV